MFSKSLVMAAAALAASAAISLPAIAQPGGNAQPNKEIRGAVMFWLLDRNNDGAIDKSEVEALRTVIFDAVDTDSDGKVTREEFIEVIGDRGGPREMRGDRHDGPRGKWEQRGDRRDGRGKGDFAERGSDRMMDRLGINASGGLSKGDFVGATPKLFERADADDNGAVSQPEFEQASRHIGRLIILE